MNRHDISREYRRSVLHNIPRLVFDVWTSRSLRELYGFMYFNFPYGLRQAGFPVRVTVEVTNRCNLRCTHCHRYAANKHRAAGAMKLGLFRKIVDELARHRGTILKIGGWGEPALHKNFGEMLSQCVDADVRTVVYTNGTVFERLTSKEILELKQTTIVVSVDGHDRDEYNAIRVGGNYDRLRERMAQLYRQKKEGNSRFPVLVVQHVVFPNDTARHIEDFRRSWTADSDMVDFCVYNPFVEAGTPVENVFRRRCKRIKRELSILYDGRVPVCGPQSKYSEGGEVGNVATGSIAEIWNGPRLAEVRAAHLTRDLHSMPLCKSCIYFR